MPASERAPEPRASPSSTVSAWSSRVCAEQDGGGADAGPPPRRARRTGRPGRGLGPTAAADRDGRHLDRVEPEPSRAQRAAAAATSAEPACRPWSTTTAPARTAGARRLERDRGGQRERVRRRRCRRRARGPPGLEVGQRRADRRRRTCGDGRVRAAHPSTPGHPGDPGAGSASSARSGSVGGGRPRPG